MNEEFVVAFGSAVIILTTIFLVLGGAVMVLAAFWAEVTGKTALVRTITRLLMFTGGISMAVCGKLLWLQL